MPIVQQRPGPGEPPPRSARPGWARRAAGWLALVPLALAACTGSNTSSAGDASNTGAPQGRAADPRIATLGADIRLSIADARDRVFPALVNIDVVVLEFKGGKESKFRATG
ncbi:MAG TPA: hypothetical protein PL072_05340, partial [Phycisphaerales bacterium]|nr:hypothetical protein [Phycisphaerales bacterium]